MEKILLPLALAHELWSARWLKRPGAHLDAVRPLPLFPGTVFFITICFSPKYCHVSLGQSTSVSETRFYLWASFLPFSTIVHLLILGIVRIFLWHLSWKTSISFFFTWFWNALTHIGVLPQEVSLFSSRLLSYVCYHKKYQYSPVNYCHLLASHQCCHKKYHCSPVDYYHLFAGITPVLTQEVSLFSRLLLSSVCWRCALCS